MRIIDAHVHTFGEGMTGVDRLLDAQSQFGYAASNYLSCECMGDASQNALAIYMKAKAPANYIYGGFSYRFGLDFAEEVKQLHALGFDGMKMVENKPTLRKELGIPFDDPRYHEAFRYMEAAGMPLLAHIGDPVAFWDTETLPEWALAAGYNYGDGSFVSMETLRAEVDQVLTMFPNLKVILAHFYFMSADLEALDSWMGRHPNVSLDIVAGTEMYWDFASRPEEWREFFLKYQRRIIFGTDNYNHIDSIDSENARVINKMELGFLTQTGEVPAWDQATVGISLPDDVLRRILAENFETLNGREPRRLNTDKAIDYLNGRMALSSLKNEELTTIENVLKYLQTKR